VIYLIKDRLKMLRKSEGYTQGELAEKLDIPLSTYSNWEQGTRNPDYNILMKLATIYDCSVDYLIGRTDKKKESINVDGYSVVISKAKEAKIPPDALNAYIDFLKKSKD
jgi:transcriptional regulator with XRE-family HTH domain